MPGLIPYFEQLVDLAREAGVDLQEAFVEAGISRATWDRAKHGRYSMREETARAVADAIARLRQEADGHGRVEAEEAPARA